MGLILFRKEPNMYKQYAEILRKKKSFVNYSLGMRRYGIIIELYVLKAPIECGPILQIVRLELPVPFLLNWIEYFCSSVVIFNNFFHGYRLNISRKNGW